MKNEKINELKAKIAELENHIKTRFPMAEKLIKNGLQIKGRCGQVMAELQKKKQELNLIEKS